jgi:hypothetical protein
MKLRFSIPLWLGDSVLSVEGNAGDGDGVPWRAYCVAIGAIAISVPITDATR